MTTIPLTAIRRFIKARLARDTELTALVGQAIYCPRVPREAVYPCVLYAYQGLGPTGAGDTAFVPEGRPLGSYLFIVQAIIDNGDNEMAEAIALAIERLLAGAKGQSGEYDIERVYNVEPIEIPETDEDTSYDRLGAIYAFSLRQK